MSTPFKMKNSSLRMSAKQGTPMQANYGTPMKDNHDEKSTKKSEKTYVEPGKTPNITNTERIISAADKDVTDKKHKSKIYYSVDDKGLNYSKGNKTTTKTGVYKEKNTDDKNKSSEVIYTKDKYGKITRSYTKSTKNRKTGKTNTKSKTYTPKTKIGDFIYQLKMKKLNKKSKKNVEKNVEKNVK